MSIFFKSTPHWVISKGVTVQVAWNIGKINYSQYVAARECNQINIANKKEIALGSVDLTWALVLSNEDAPLIAEPKLFEMIW